ncbi:hypothetical protein M3M33_16880, partial [Loigolactobacillus coryniformis]|uniref:hypothetical protein n=1 Tax=Loigolactobacillus coryniformis TaxID=1610 RepID=UPI00201B27D5
YESGELNILKPGTSDAFWTVRDEFSRVVNYPYLFFDNASHGRKISMRVGVCKECRNSSIGIQFGVNIVNPKYNLYEENR